MYNDLENFQVLKPEFDGSEHWFTDEDDENFLNLTDEDILND